MAVVVVGVVLLVTMRAMVMVRMLDLPVPVAPTA
jgi:hypothetical protein